MNFEVYVLLEKGHLSFQIDKSKLQKAVTAYKGNKKLAYETDATGAVGLGDASIFQSFMVCSEYSPTRTRLSFSKVAAGA